MTRVLPKWNFLKGTFRFFSGNQHYILKVVVSCLTFGTLCLSEDNIAGFLSLDCTDITWY